MTMEFYPRDTVILKQDDKASDALRIIKKGGVKVSVRTESGEEMIIDHRGEGDTFGLMSLIGQDKQKTTVTALEDTICYLLEQGQDPETDRGESVIHRVFPPDPFYQVRRQGLPGDAEQEPVLREQRPSAVHDPGGGHRDEGRGHGPR